MGNSDLTKTVLGWLAVKLHEAADNSNDRYDHDEYHAAGAVLQLVAGLPFNDQYIKRWVIGLRKRAGIEGS